MASFTVFLVTWAVLYIWSELKRCRFFDEKFVTPNCDWPNGTIGNAFYGKKSATFKIQALDKN